MLRIFDRQEDLRANRARARIKFLIDRIGIDEFRRMVDEELEGRLGRRARLRSRRRCCSSTTRRPSAPADPLELRQPERRQPASSTQFVASNVQPAAPGGLLHGRGEGHPRRPHARAVPRPRRRSCATSPAATRARASSRTSCCAGSATRALYDVWQRLEELGPRRRRRARDHRRRQLPRHRQLQARHHQLDGPQRRRAGAARADADRRPADASRST